VRLIVGANIVFSAILNSNGRIGDILINSGKRIDFIAPDFLRQEIFEHYTRLSKISGLTFEKLRETEFQICSSITFISEEQIKKSAWLFAHNLVHDVDLKDTPYVAFAKHFKCKLWSGDKKLMKGLSKKKFLDFITTDELYELLENGGSK